MIIGITTTRTTTDDIDIERVTIEYLQSDPGFDSERACRSRL